MTLPRKIKILNGGQQFFEKNQPKYDHFCRIIGEIFMKFYIKKNYIIDLI